MKPALLIDLDETLIVEEPAAVAAFEAMAQFAASGCEVDPASLATGARLRARELWYAAPTHDYCARVGISAWEGLWCRFEGEGADEDALRDWSPTYRQEAWSLGAKRRGSLANQGNCGTGHRPLHSRCLGLSPSQGFRGRRPVQKGQLGRASESCAGAMRLRDRTGWLEIASWRRDQLVPKVHRSLLFKVCL